MAEKSSIPLCITVDDGNVKPCERAEDCGRWVQGVQERKVTAGKLTGWTLLTAVGCQFRCDGIPHITRMDRDALDIHVIEESETQESDLSELERGQEVLAHKANQLFDS